MNRTLTTSLALAAATLLAGCKEDLTPALLRFEQLDKGWEQEIDWLRAEGSEQQHQLAELLNTSGLDRNSPLALRLESLRASASNDKVSIEVVARAAQRHRNMLEKAAKSGKLRLLNEVIDVAHTQMITDLETVGDAADVRRNEVKAAAAEVQKWINDHASSSNRLSAAQQRGG